MSNETKIALMKARINLLNARDEMMNAHIVAKIKRRIRMLEGE